MKDTRRRACFICDNLNFGDNSDLFFFVWEDLDMPINSCRHDLGKENKIKG